MASWSRASQRWIRLAGRRTIMPLWAAVVAWSNPPGRPRGNKSIPTTYDLGSELQVEVYRFGESISSLALSVFWRDQELLRVDLVPGREHVHYGVAQVRSMGASTASVRIPSASPPELIERTAFELRHNLAYCLAIHPSRRVSRLSVDDSTLDAAAQWATGQLEALVDEPTHPG